jgi:ABC-type Zn2+ transport system substrate-binding protein/surface adhesin
VYENIEINKQLRADKVRTEQMLDELFEAVANNDREVVATLEYVESKNFLIEVAHYEAFEEFPEKFVIRDFTINN